ncbi:MAG: hypothetical protein PHS57_03160 [Alphaproteobacteria bacterium]|nr:hypothetical protein [Alphaproteobacteria bacterium]
MSAFRIDPPKDRIDPSDPSKYAEEAQKYIWEYREYVKNTILTAMADPSGTDVLGHKEFVILYSGPSKKVGEQIKCVVRYNDTRSEDMALEFSASRINDTVAGIELNGIPLNPPFSKILAPLYPNPRKLEDAVRDAYATVWGGISELFADLDFKTAATAVCGAGQDRVFVKDELPVLVRNPHVRTINEIDMEAVRRMYNEVSPDEAFRLVCLSELSMTLRKAQATGVPPTEGWTDFFERHFFYSVERDDTEAGIPALTDEQRKRKERILVDFGLKDLFSDSPIEWAKPHKPPAKLTPPVKASPKPV